ncbi:carbohydrate binding domain-containing protein [Bacillus daqingensis]|uniref:Carbohydrate binding domain-containing protein n=1 Tax=Bacillus daqingensis TaxID=872396 RepID=A0ABV9P0T9_9BACI
MKKGLVFTAAAGLAGAALLALPQEGKADKEDWSLIWEDKFEGDTLNEDNWTIDIGNGFEDANGNWVPGWGNEELQSYQEDNVTVEDGELILEAREETVSDERGTYDYTSGKIHSQGKFSQKYGRFEAKMKLPEGQGYWPAFWMMPEDDVYGGWAASGEIDIMEAAGGRTNKIGGAIHYGGEWPQNTYTARDYYFPEGTDITDYNEYAVEWEPGEIRWYVNDELYQTLNNWSSVGAGNAEKFSYPAPFDQEFHLILNLAVGGWYGGDPDETTEFEGQVKVDYVRAYELTGRDYMEPVEPEFEPEELPEGAKEAIDGNYIYDTSFAEPFRTISTNAELETEWTKDYWNFVKLGEFNGDGSVTAEEVDGESFARASITSGGSQPYSVQLIQNVTLAEGRWYELSFDAFAAADRTMNVKIGGGPERGYTAYSPARDFALTTEKQRYTMAFQMQHESDALARLEYNLGLNTSDVWIGNPVLKEIDAADPYDEMAPKQPLANGNLIHNGTFDQGRMDRMTHWLLDTEGAEAQASVDANRRELDLQIADGGTEPEAVQLSQYGLSLQQNAEYILSFDARADEERELTAALMSKDGSEEYGRTTLELGTGMATHEAVFSMEGETNPEGRLVFLAGGADTDITLDNVSLMGEGMALPLDELTMEERFPLLNGFFLRGTEGWTTHVQGDYGDSSSAGSFAAADGTGVFTVEHTGANPWDVLLAQEELKVLQGQEYTIQFDARSSLDRSIGVIAENSSYERSFDEKAELTNDWQTYTYTFTQGSDGELGLKFLLGTLEGSDAISEAHDVEFTNVYFEVSGAREQLSPLRNGSFESGFDGWNTHLQGDFDGDSAASFTADDGEARIDVSNTGTNPWDIQLFQPDLELKDDVSYTLQFDAASTVDRKLEVAMDAGEAGGYYRFGEDVVELTNEMQTYTLDFTMTDDSNLLLIFMMGAVDGTVISEGHTITVDNVALINQDAAAFFDARNGKPETEEPAEPAEPEEPEVPADWKADIAALQEQTAAYAEDGAVTGPLRNQLANTVRQALHHAEADRTDQAVSFIERFAERLHSNLGERHVEPEAKEALLEQIDVILEQN